MSPSETIIITILDDILVEETEIIILDITVMNPDVLAADYNTAQIEIFDNDGTITLINKQAAMFIIIIMLKTLI